MRILMIHASEFSFHATEETSVAAAAGDVAEDAKSGDSGDSLVCFISAEKVSTNSLLMRSPSGMTSMPVSVGLVQAAVKRSMAAEAMLNSHVILIVFNLV